MYRVIKCYFVETELDFLFYFSYEVLAPRKFSGRVYDVKGGAFFLF